jgi:hypothetical protein
MSTHAFGLSAIRRLERVERYTHGEVDHVGRLEHNEIVHNLNGSYLVSTWKLRTLQSQ